MQTFDSGKKTGFPTQHGTLITTRNSSSIVNDCFFFNYLKNYYFVRFQNYHSISIFFVVLSFNNCSVKSFCSVSCTFSKIVCSIKSSVQLKTIVFSKICSNTLFA